MRLRFSHAVSIFAIHQQARFKTNVHTLFTPNQLHALLPLKHLLREFLLCFGTPRVRARGWRCGIGGHCTPVFGDSFLADDLGRWSGALASLIGGGGSRLRRRMATRSAQVVTTLGAPHFRCWSPGRRNSLVGVSSVLLLCLSEKGCYNAHVQVSRFAFLAFLLVVKVTCK